MKKLDDLIEKNAFLSTALDAARNNSFNEFPEDFYKFKDKKAQEILQNSLKLVEFDLINSYLDTFFPDSEDRSVCTKSAIRDKCINPEFRKVIIKYICDQEMRNNTLITYSPTITPTGEYIYGKPVQVWTSNHK